MRFTSDDAFDGRETGDSIWLSRAATMRICIDHGTSIAELQLEYPEQAGHWDAADVLQWLGY